jgi:hypothetical protein
VIHQLLGPVFNLVGDGGFAAWKVGDWLVVKYANLVLIGLVAGLFLAGMFFHLPESKDTAGVRVDPGDPGESR